MNNQTSLISFKAGNTPLKSIGELLSYSGPQNATTHAPDVSDAYNFISTAQVLRGIDSRQWGVAEFKTMGTKKLGHDGFQKHMIKLQRFDQVGLKESQQIVLINSHNRASGFRVCAGVFRLVCSNGLIVGNDYGFSVRHIGGNSDKVIDAVFKVIKDSDDINSKIDSLKSVQLSSEQIRQFSNAALAIRFDEERLNQLRGESLLHYTSRIRRQDDASSDLWTVFNRVQENLSNKIHVGGGGRSIQSLKAIDSNMKFNRDLWTLAENTAKGLVA